MISVCRGRKPTLYDMHVIDRSWSTEVGRKTPFSGHLRLELGIFSGGTDLAIDQLNREIRSVDQLAVYRIGSLSFLPPHILLSTLMRGIMTLRPTIVVRFMWESGRKRRVRPGSR